MEKVIFDTDKCKGCGLCASACPKQIIEFDDSINAKGYHPAMVKKQNVCISCGNCAMMCPDLIITVRKEIVA